MLYHLDDGIGMVFVGLHWETVDESLLNAIGSIGGNTHWHEASLKIPLICKYYLKSTEIYISVNQ